MNTKIETILNKFRLSGYALYDNGEYYMAIKGNQEMKLIVPRRDDVWVSEALSGVSRLSDGKFMTARHNEYAIVDPFKDYESSSYEYMEERIVWNGKVYLVAGFNKGLGVIDSDDNNVVNTMYTFINFTVLNESVCIIIASKLESGIDGLIQRDAFFDMSGKLLGITKVLMGRPYLIMGDKFYIKGTDIIYDVNGVRKNGGNR